MSLALFDLDHTLLDGDSNTLWLEYLVDNGHVPATVLAAQADYMARYAAEQLDISDYYGFHLGLLGARPLSDWLPVRKAFVASCIAPRISVEALVALAEHRAQGDTLAIITATHSFLSDAVGELLDVPVIASRAEVRKGALTGRIEGPICFREQKQSCLIAWLRAGGMDEGALRACRFYSDSANDLPLLEAVSHPVVVNADERLAAVAKARKWPALSWRCA
ncbi:MAG: HAD family hydrolase [Azoarcus sp.]